MWNVSTSNMQNMLLSNGEFYDSRLGNPEVSQTCISTIKFELILAWDLVEAFQPSELLLVSFIWWDQV